MFFTCPRCGKDLFSIDEKTKKCLQGHSYDKAREGYYNLLLSNVGGTHGDNVEMVRARRNFLSYGFYEPMAKKVAEMAILYHKTDGVLLDMGLGEGYYTDMVERAIYLRDGRSNVLGFDISKEAVKYAAKRNPRLSLSVASSYSVPMARETVDTVMNIFSPMAISEVIRLLKKDGYFIFVYPGVEHLYGLKSVIYRTPYKNKPESDDIEGLELISKEELRYTVTLDGRDKITSLFMMTPYAYRTGREDRERVLSSESVTTELDFIINVYRKAE